MYCGKCGQRVEKDNIFCGKCGAKIVRQEALLLDESLLDDEEISITDSIVEEKSSNDATSKDENEKLDSGIYFEDSDEVYAEEIVSNGQTSESTRYKNLNDEILFNTIEAESENNSIYMESNTEDNSISEIFKSAINSNTSNNDDNRISKIELENVSVDQEPLNEISELADNKNNETLQKLVDSEAVESDKNQVDFEGHEDSKGQEDPAIDIFKPAAIIFLITVITVVGFYFISESPKIETINYSYGQYYGEVKDNKPNGMGKMTFKDKSVMEAKFKNGIAEGSARVTLPDGTYAEGNLINGNRNGKWTIIKNNSHYIYEQDYVSNVPIGSEKKIVPITISSISLYNSDGKGNSNPLRNNIVKYGEVSYIGSTLNIHSSYPKPWKGKLDIKYFNPNGTLNTGNSSPQGYSFVSDEEFNVGNNEIVTMSWGREGGYAYPPGTYRIEYYWDGNLLGTTTFTVER